MARIADKEQARKLRSQGKSYSEIKHVLGIGKGTLSEWLRDMPLSRDRINQLRAKSPRRIEKFRETMRLKRESKLHTAYERAKKDIKKLSARDVFIAGLYLYWGEGTKAARGTVAVANTDPAVIRAFLNWLTIMRVPKDKIRIKLHLYSDMDQKKEARYWEQELDLPQSQFRKPYIKATLSKNLSYRNGFGHGTCNAYFENMLMWEYITMALKCIREQHMRP